MAKSSFSLRYLLDVRAGGCCEYCRRYKVMTGAMFFEIEHILPLSFHSIEYAVVAHRLSYP